MEQIEEIEIIKHFKPYNNPFVKGDPFPNCAINVITEPETSIKRTILLREALFCCSIQISQNY